MSETDRATVKANGLRVEALGELVSKMRENVPVVNYKVTRDLLLAADVGGTKTLLGLFDRTAARPRERSVRAFATLNFDSLPLHPFQSRAPPCRLYGVTDDHLYDPRLAGFAIPPRPRIILN